jgi:hypothetical protein
MWALISCYLGGHDYNVCCESGAIFLRCQVCGRRSPGWNVRPAANCNEHPEHHA